MKFFRLSKILFFLMLFLAAVMSGKTGFLNSHPFHKHLSFSTLTFNIFEEASIDEEEESNLDFIEFCFAFDYLYSAFFSICLILSYFYITPKSLIFGFTNLPPPRL